MKNGVIVMKSLMQKQYGPILLCNIVDDAPKAWDVEGATHVRVSLPVNIQHILEMQELGYQFVDRMLDVTINLKRNEIDLDKCIRMQPTLTTEYRKEIVELATANFDTDRRFHVDVNYDQSTARAVICGWVEEIPEFYVCLYKEKVIGFLGLKEQKELKRAEISLAAVDKKYRSSGAALALYASALKAGIEKGYSTITGYISSGNTAVMNLYAYLGGTFSNPTDIFLKK